MVIQAQWPGASAEEVTCEVTDRIEKKLEELEASTHESVTVVGQTTVFVDPRASTKASDVGAHSTWLFTDRGTSIATDHQGSSGWVPTIAPPRLHHAFTSDGQTMCDRLEDEAETPAPTIHRRERSEKSPLGCAGRGQLTLRPRDRKIAALGLDTRSIMASFAARNAVTPSGFSRPGGAR